MALFKFVVSDKEFSKQIEKEQQECPVSGKKIGETITGDFLGLDGYQLKITGGHDKNGFCMHPDIDGVVRRRVLLTKGRGFSARLKRKKKLGRTRSGLRKRKTVVGNTISHEIVQINLKVENQGSKPFKELFPAKSKEEAPKSE